MKIIRKCIIPIIILTLLFTGCTTSTNTEETTVSVNIVNMEYTPSWMQPLIINNMLIYIPHPSQYIIEVEYNDNIYQFDNAECYDKYKDQVNATIQAKCLTTYNNNDITKVDIVELY